MPPIKKIILFGLHLFGFLITCILLLNNPAFAVKIKNQATKVTITFNGQVDLCLDCHKDTPDRAHGRQVIPCSSCHLGNPLAGTSFEAHKGMVLNPGELKIVHKTCGQEGCHVSEVNWVKNTLMATNRGIISTLRYYWGETDNHNEKLTVWMLKNSSITSLAIDYFKKLCGTCHLYLERHKLPGFLAEKGGGCTACHFLKLKENNHPQITKAIPMENCVKCHNRSGRIGLTYQGLYENEGYGTPFDEGDTSKEQLPDGRFVQKISPDIHFEKGLVCIDCHTKKELMGDGKQRAHLYDQVEIECTTCHGGSNILKTLLREAKDPKEKFPKLTNLVEKDGKFYLKGKTDGKLHPLNKFPKDKCKDKDHLRLSCQACHSKWVPQCYGCHVRYDRSEKQLDKLKLKESFGKWEEFKSFMRYEEPVLGVLEGNSSADSKVVILVPG